MSRIRSHDSWQQGISPFARSFRDLVNRMASAIYRFMAIEDRLMAKINEDPPVPSYEPMRVQLTASSATDGDYRWEYTFEQVKYLPDGTVTTLANGVTGVAYNRRELNHTAQYAWGVDVNGASYPAGFGPRPVGGGGTTDSHKTDVVTLVWSEDNDGQVAYWFSEMGSHDGEC